MMGTHIQSNIHGKRIGTSSGVCSCWNIIIRDTIISTKPTQRLLLISFLLVSVHSWVGIGPVIPFKYSIDFSRQRVSLLKKHSWRKFTPNYCRLKSFLTLTNENDVMDDDMNIAAPTDDNINLQWQLFGKHHARCTNFDESSPIKTTSWVGKWTTYDYVGDIVLETMPASVNYISSCTPTSTGSPDKVDVLHTISTGSTSSDCETCFDDPNSLRTIPITTYTPENIATKSRLGACGMVVGPSILRSSGTMATELILSHTTSRIRIVFQHAPVWARGTEPGSCPPQGLKLIRCLLARETLVASCDSIEASLSQVLMPGTGQHPIFDRSVPPFDWHKKWSGTSWTWGPEAGDRGWGLPELEIGVDDWHGCAPVEAWNLRLPGGIFIQLPRVITGDVIERCRLAWMPNADTLLRFEAGVMALQPILGMDSDSMVGFEPPTLASLRCDVLENNGDLEGVPSFVQQEMGNLSVGESEPINNDDVNDTLQLSNVEDRPRSSQIDDDESKRRAIHSVFQL